MRAHICVRVCVCLCASALIHLFPFDLLFNRPYKSRFLIVAQLWDAVAVMALNATRQASEYPLQFCPFASMHCICFYNIHRYMYVGVCIAPRSECIDN